MTTNTGNEVTSIQDQAARWVVKLNRARLSKEEAFALEDWLSESESHHHALQSLGQVWLDTGEVLETQQARDALSVTATVSAWAKLRPARAWSGLAGACLVLVGVLAGWTSWMSSGFEQRAVQTAVGEHRLVELADGSSIHLNTNTQIETDLNHDERSVKLLRGEALFTVAKEASRPFRVHIGGDMVEAVGTVFRIRATAATEVTVTEGRVKLVLPGPKVDAGSVDGESSAHIESDESIAQVGAGRKAVFESDRVVVKKVSTEIIDKELAWRRGMLRFDGDTLEDAVAEFSRYTDTTITLDDDVRITRIVGYFNAGDTDRFISALRTTLHIAAESTAKGAIHLYLLPDETTVASPALKKHSES